MSDDLKPDQNRDASVNGEQTSIGAKAESAGASAHLLPNCERMGPELKAYADGQSNLWQRFVVERQLARCPACRAEVEEMRRFRAALQEADSVAFTPALRARILAAVPESVRTTAPDVAPNGSTRPQFRSPLRHPLALAGGIAGTIVVAVLCYPLLAPSGFKQNSTLMAAHEVDQSLPMTPSVPAPATRSSVSAGEPSRSNVADMTDTSTTKREAKARPQIASAAVGGMATPSKPQIAAEAATLPIEIAVSAQDIEACTALIETETRQIGGVVVLSRIDKSVDTPPVSELTLKIPAARLEAFRDHIHHAELTLTAPHAHETTNTYTTTKNHLEHAVEVVVRVTKRE